MGICRDCFNNCDKTMSDKCVKYTGPTIEWLGICTGDQLSYVEAALIEKLEGLVTGDGITLPDLELCESVEDALDGEDPTIENILQAVLDVLCEVKDDVVSLQDDVQDPISFNADCLEVGTNLSRDEILQAVVTKVCSQTSTIDDIVSDYVKASELCSLVAECLENSESESVIQEYTKMPKYVALPYHGSLSVFDAAGKGISATGYDKVYLCVGQTVSGFTLPDYRGRVPVGTNVGMPGAAMDSDVDPAVLANVGYNINQGGKKGNFTNTLTIAQLAAHNHTITDPGHEHALVPAYVTDASGGLSYSSLKGDTDDNGNNPIKTTSVTTGITIASTGSSQPHNNTQPSMGAAFIMYIP